MPKVIFAFPDGHEKVVDAPNGISLLEVAHKNEIPLEGACEGSLACSTCHVIVDAEDFARLPEASEAEEDLLDLASHVTRFSRLACQILIPEGMERLTVRIPGGVHNMRGR